MTRYIRSGWMRHILIGFALGWAMQMAVGELLPATTANLVIFAPVQLLLHMYPSLYGFEFDVLMLPIPVWGTMGALGAAAATHCYRKVTRKQAAETGAHPIGTSHMGVWSKASWPWRIFALMGIGAVIWSRVGWLVYGEVWDVFALHIAVAGLIVFWHRLSWPWRGCVLAAVVALVCTNPPGLLYEGSDLVVYILMLFCWELLASSSRGAWLWGYFWGLAGFWWILRGFGPLWPITGPAFWAPQDVVWILIAVCQVWVAWRADKEARGISLAAQDQAAGQRHIR